METINDSSFVVYVRVDKPHAAAPETLEQPYKSCSSYAEAKQVLKECRKEAIEGVIRFEGISGGGD